MQIKFLDRVISHLMLNRAHTAMKYVSPTFVVRVTRQLNMGKVPRDKDNIELAVTVGRPNFLERRFIKQCIKVGEKFPMRKIQLKYVPKGRAKKAKARVAARMRRAKKRK